MTFRRRTLAVVAVAVLLVIGGIAIWRGRRPVISSRDIHPGAAPAAESQAPRSAKGGGRPELVLQTGHLDRVTSVAFSPDGRLLVSYGNDGTMKVWDGDTGRELRSFAVSALSPDVGFSRDSQWVTIAEEHLRAWWVLTGRTVDLDERTVDRSGDGKWIVGTDANGVVVWNAASGAESRVSRAGTAAGRSARFSPDSRWLAVEEQLGGGVSVEELANLRKVKELIAEDSVEITTTILETGTWRAVLTIAGRRPLLSPAVFSPDGRLLAMIGDGRKTVEIWDISGARKLAARTSPAPLAMLAFSPDSRLLAAASASYVDLVESVRRSSPAHDAVASARSLVLWDLTNDDAPRTFDARAGVSALAFSPDGRKLATAGPDGVMYRDLPSASAEPVRVDDGSCEAVAFSADGRRIAWGRQKDVRVRDLVGNETQRVLTASVEPVGAVALSPDGRWLATANEAGGRNDSSALRLWDLAAGREAHSLSAVPEAIRALLFSPDGRKITAVGRTIETWDTATGERWPGAGSDETPPPLLVFNHDGRRIVFGPDPQGNLLVGDIGSKSPPRALPVAGRVDHIMLSPDGRWLATGRIATSPDFSDGVLFVWDLTTLTRIRTWNENSFNPTVSPDGRYFAAAGGAGRPSLKVWDVASGAELLAVGTHFAADAGVVNAITFSPDSRLVAFSDSAHAIQIWEVAARRQLATLVGHTSYVGAIAFDPQGQRVISTSADGTIRFWSVAGSELLVTLVFLKDPTQWLAVTPEGLFDGSPDAWNRILWRFSENTFDVAPVDTFFGEFYYPGLLAETFAGRRPAAPRDIAQLDRRQPAIRISTADAGGSARQVSLRIDVEEVHADAAHPAGSGVRDLRLFRNGSLVKAWRGDVLAGGAGRAALEVAVPIVAGANRFTAYAFNHDNVKSEDAALSVTGAKSLERPGIAYVLAIGVNDYANPSFNLKYAVADATRFGEEFAAQQRRVGRFGEVRVVPLMDRDATKDRVLGALKDLAGAAQPEDLVVLFFAGHGVTDGARFYIVPHDLGYAGARASLNAEGVRTIAEHSLSDQELEHALEGVDAERVLLVIDACHSGQALEAAEKRLGPMNSKGLAQLAYEKGMYVLTAAQSYQAALETERLGHGFLTYALVEAGLASGGADDAPRDGTIFLREWLDYAAARVPQLQLDVLREARGLKLAFVAGEESLAPAKRTLQRPRVFYRREIESHPLVIARISSR